MTSDKNLESGTRLTDKKLRCSRGRAEDLEDLRDLNAAIERNQGKPGIPWDQVKKVLAL
ncbi:MAG TPA: hypothetical protein VGW33_06505 [Terriglobia bacterium]|nr:hypothetical protein [Terriglobia bacterium]